MGPLSQAAWIRQIPVRLFGAILTLFFVVAVAVLSVDVGNPLPVIGVLLAVGTVIAFALWQNRREQKWRRAQL